MRAHGYSPDIHAIPQAPNQATVTQSRNLRRRRCMPIPISKRHRQRDFHDSVLYMNRAIVSTLRNRIYKIEERSKADKSRAQMSRTKNYFFFFIYYEQNLITAIRLLASYFVAFNKRKSENYRKQKLRASKLRN